MATKDKRIYRVRKEAKKSSKRVYRVYFTTDKKTIRVWSVDGTLYYRWNSRKIRHEQADLPVGPDGRLLMKRWAIEGMINRQ